MLGWLRSSRRPTLPQGERIYAIGDVHGCLDLLDELLLLIRADNARRGGARVTLIMLGDLIDRGPCSREVIERTRAGLDWAETIALMGNHEAILLDSLDGDTERLRSWLTYGGREALLSWGVDARLLDEGTLEDILAAARVAIPAEDRRFLSRMRRFVRRGDYYFVHAGIRPGLPLDRQVDEDRLWIRSEFLESNRSHGAVIVHGHSISADVEQRKNRIGIDTGAYATGRLTALGLEGGERWLLSTGAPQ